MKEIIEISLKKADFLPYICEKCGDGAPAFWVAPCGHIFCEKCKAEKCQTCRPTNRLAAIFYRPKRSFKLFLESLAETEDGELENAQCAICLDELTSPMALKCGHVSCGTCLLSWRRRQRNGKCPTCRVAYHAVPVRVKAGKIADSASENSDVSITIEEDEGRDENFPGFMESDTFRTIAGVLIIVAVIAFWGSMYAMYSYLSRHNRLH